MIKKLEKSFAVSPKGAKDLIKGCVACALFNISLMLPVGLLYTVVKDLMLGAINSSRYPFYIGGGVLALVLIMLTAIMQYNTTYFATYAESGVRRIGLAEQIRKLPLAFFGKRDIADLTSTIMADCTYLEQAFSHYIPELFGAMISVSLMTASLFIFDWRMALAALWVVPVSFGIVILAVKIQDYLNTKQIAVRMVCADGIQECLESMRDLKSNNAEASYLKGLTKKIKDVETGALITELGVAIVVVSAQMILKLGIATVTLVGGMLLVEGSIDIFTFFFFLLVASRLYDPLQGALINLAASIETRVHISRMNEILYYPTQQGEERLTQEGCTIVFDRVGFSYESGEEVLNDVSFTAEQGQVTALVGPSGGGKTTVSRLAARFWDSNRGNITVGGMPISKVSPETLLSLYAIVFQDVLLFNNTIMENIRIGKKDATDEEVLEAARLANCDVFANKLPRGYHTLIGENGGELSGGERQRISIARAFLKNAPIILLDEATASLDVENEILIQTALTRLIQNKTVLVIAHRMRTIAGADKIVVLKDGKVAEQGSPKKLWEQEGIYRHMSDRQLQSQQWMFKEIDIKKTCF